MERRHLGSVLMVTALVWLAPGSAASQDRAAPNPTPRCGRLGATRTCRASRTTTPRHPSSVRVSTRGGRHSRTRNARHSMPRPLRIRAVTGAPRRGRVLTCREPTTTSGGSTVDRTGGRHWLSIRLTGGYRRERRLESSVPLDGGGPGTSSRLVQRTEACTSGVSRAASRCFLARTTTTFRSCRPRTMSPSSSR